MSNYNLLNRSRGTGLVTTRDLLCRCLVLLDDPCDVHHGVSSIKVHDLHALCIAANHPDSIDREADDHTLPGNHHQLVVRYDLLERHDRAGLLGLLESDDALTTTLLHAVIRQLRSLAVALLAHNQQTGVTPNHNHPNDLVALFELDALYASGRAAHVANIIMVEPDAHAILRRQNDVAVLAADLDVDQLIVLFDVDTADSVRANVTVGGENRLLHGALSGRENEALVVGEFSDGH